MKYYIGTIPVSPCLEHHGILGMQWGKRRFQNSNGSLTDEGRARYGVSKETSKKISKAEAKKKSTIDAIKRGAKIAAVAAAVAIPVSIAVKSYNKRHEFELLNKSVEEYTKELLKRNGSKFKYYDDWDLWDKWN